MKYYAVKKGFHTGIFTTWDKCKKEVHGYPSALYKSFKTKSEATAYLNSGAKAQISFDDVSSTNSNHKTTTKSTTSRKTVPTNIVNTDDEPIDDKDTAVAYCDGSFDIRTQRFSYGLIIFYNGEEYTDSKAFTDPQLATMRNVAGEIEGSKAAMQYCADNGIKALNLYYDYMGIEQWCIGGWKTNKQGTIDYKKFYDDIKTKVKVNFCKVKGHSGDKYNDVVDGLAKKALGII